MLRIQRASNLMLTKKRQQALSSILAYLRKHGVTRRDGLIGCGRDYAARVVALAYLESHELVEQLWDPVTGSPAYRLHK